MNYFNLRAVPDFCRCIIKIHSSTLPGRPNSKERKQTLPLIQTQSLRKTPPWYRNNACVCSPKICWGNRQDRQWKSCLVRPRICEDATGIHSPGTQVLQSAFKYLNHRSGPYL